MNIPASQWTILISAVLLAAAGCRQPAEPFAPPPETYKFNLAGALLEADFHLAAVRQLEYRQRFRRESDRHTLLLQLPSLAAEAARKESGELRLESRKALELAIYGLLEHLPDREERRDGRVRQRLAEETALLYRQLVTVQSGRDLLERCRAQHSNSAGFIRLEQELTAAGEAKSLELRTMLGLPPGTDLVLEPPDSDAGALFPELLPALTMALSRRPESAGLPFQPADLAAAALELKRALPPTTADTPAARNFGLAELLLRLPRQLELRRLEERRTPPELTYLALALGLAGQLETGLAEAARQRQEWRRKVEEAALTAMDFPEATQLLGASERLDLALIRLRTDLGLSPLEKIPGDDGRTAAELPADWPAATELLLSIFAQQQP